MLHLHILQMHTRGDEIEHRRLHVLGMLGSDRRGWVFVMGWVSVMGWGSELWSVVCGLWSVAGDQWSVVGDQSKTSGAVKQRWTW